MFAVGMKALPIWLGTVIAPAIKLARTPKSFLDVETELMHFKVTIQYGFGVNMPQHLACTCDVHRAQSQT